MTHRCRNTDSNYRSHQVRRFEATSVDPLLTSSFRKRRTYFERGTDVSNPDSSSAESANHRLLSGELAMLRCRSMPEVRTNADAIIDLADQDNLVYFRMGGQISEGLGDGLGRRARAGRRPLLRESDPNSAAPPVQ